MFANGVRFLRPLFRSPSVSIVTPFRSHLSRSFSSAILDANSVRNVAIVAHVDHGKTAR